MPELTVYGAPWCPYCQRTKRFLEAQRVDFRYVDIDREPDAVATLQQLQGGGRTIPTGAAAVDPGNNKQLVLSLPPLGPGRYRVHWHVVSVDTHRTEGEYSFTIEP